MSVDALAEQEAILAHARALVGGRIYDGVEDDAVIEQWATGSIRPYIVIEFGEPFPSYSDRSMAGEEQQPLIMPGVFTCWGANSGICRVTAGAVRTRFIGFKPSENNAGQMRLAGGGDFRQKDTAASPTRFARSVNFEFSLNMSVEQLA